MKKIVSVLILMILLTASVFADYVIRQQVLMFQSGKISNITNYYYFDDRKDVGFVTIPGEFKGTPAKPEPLSKEEKSQIQFTFLFSEFYEESTLHKRQVDENIIMLYDDDIRDEIWFYVKEPKK